MKTCLNVIPGFQFSTEYNPHPAQLIHKLKHLCLQSSLCTWSLDFLSVRTQNIRVGCNNSKTITLNMGAPLGCVLSPLLFTFLTHNCAPKCSTNHIIKFVNDATVVGLISNNDEVNYKNEVSQLVQRYKTNNFILNQMKTKETIEDVRTRQQRHFTLTITGVEWKGLAAPNSQHNTTSW